MIARVEIQRSDGVSDPVIPYLPLFGSGALELLVSLRVLIKDILGVLPDVWDDMAAFGLLGLFGWLVWRALHARRSGNED